MGTAAATTRARAYACVCKQHEARDARKPREGVTLSVGRCRNAPPPASKHTETNRCKYTVCRKQGETKTMRTRTDNVWGERWEWGEWWGGRGGGSYGVEGVHINGVLAHVSAQPPVATMHRRPVHRAEQDAALAVVRRVVDAPRPQGVQGGVVRTVWHVVRSAAIAIAIGTIDGAHHRRGLHAQRHGASVR